MALLLTFVYDVLAPVFSKITTVIKTECEEVILVMNEYVTEYYDSHYRAYCISEHHNTATSLHLFSVKNLPYYNIFHLRRSFAKDNILYVGLKCQFETITNIDSCTF